MEKLNSNEKEKKPDAIQLEINFKEGEVLSEREKRQKQKEVREIEKTDRGKRGERTRGKNRRRRSR